MRSLLAYATESRGKTDYFGGQQAANDADLLGGLTFIKSLR
jgi:hypothetical protein